MNAKALFDIYAPRESPWSVWAKPVLFAGIRAMPDEPPHYDWPGLISNVDTSWAPPPDGHTVMIVDMPGRHSVLMGMALASVGYRPIPLYNGADGPLPAVSVDAIIQHLILGAPFLKDLGLSAKAPPAFLLDSERLAGGKTSHSPGTFDNRWMVFPQDLPSAGRLRSDGAREAVVVQGRVMIGEEGRERAVAYVHETIAEDLTHVLLPWQEGGIQIRTKEISDPGDEHRAPAPVTIHRPSRFRSSLCRWLVTFGFRRNSAGGFGSRVPEPSQGGGHYYG